MNLKSLLTDNVEMKLLSILLAATIWLFVAFEDVDQVEIPLAVSYVNIPSGLTVKSRGEPEGVIRVEGPRILLLRQKLKGVPIRLDLSGAKEGSMVFSGEENGVRLIQGVKLLNLSSLKVEIQR